MGGFTADFVPEQADAYKSSALFVGITTTCKLRLPAKRQLCAAMFIF